MIKTEFLMFIVILFCCYYSLFATLLTVLFYMERKTLYKLFAGTLKEQSGVSGKVLLKDRMKELREKWRSPQKPKRGAGDAS